MKGNFKKIAPWIVLILIIAGFAVWYFLSNRISASENVSYEEKISEGDSKYSNKDYAGAMVDYYGAVDIIPTRIDAFKGIIQVLLDKNRPDHALSILDQSGQKLNQNDQASLYVLIGNAYFTQGEYDKALSTYQKGQGLGVNNQDLELAIGKAYLKEGNLEGATSQFEKNIYTDQNQSEAVLLLSYIQSVTDTNKAKESLAEVNPTDKWKSYFDEFSTVLASLNTDTKFNAVKLARIYINNGYPYLTVSILEPLEGQVSEYLDGLYFLGRGYFEVGQYDKSITELDKAITLGGSEYSILWTEARDYLMKNDLNNALNCYSKALGYQGKTPSQDLVSEYLDILLQNNQTLKADQIVQSVAANMSSAYIYLYGVKVNDAVSNTQKIDYYISALEKITLTTDESKEYLYWKTKELLDQNGDITEIQNSLSDLLKIDRYNPKYYLLYGRYEFEQGNAVDAATAFKQAINYDTNNSVTDEASRLLSSVD
jgi:tetratricopeptide (TPR) repeat protein